MLFAPEERGQAHFGEPLGAARRSFYKLRNDGNSKTLGKSSTTCVQGKLSNTMHSREDWLATDGRPIHITNTLDPCMQDANAAPCVRHWKRRKATSNAMDERVWAQFLMAQQQLPDDREKLNTCCEDVDAEGSYFPLADLDSPAVFILREQPWLQPGNSRSQRSVWQGRCRRSGR